MDTSEHPGLLVVTAGPTAQVSVDTGLLAGIGDSDRDIRMFLGIPYAAPPIGEARWRPPMPCAPWEGLRDAHRFAANSLQPPLPENSLYFGGEHEFSEDCLYLNVWTGLEGDVDRPVLVWLHFGAYQYGSGSNPSFDGSALAAAGVTVVTVNHRLGRFGFLAHPDLTAESGYGGSGNYGLMDQIAALEWVQRNITAFGGDPANVTLCGVSAGGNSVHNLRCSPLARGLFSKVIAQSAPGVAPAVDGYGHPAYPSTLAAGEQAGMELADLLGVSSIEEMRRLPADAIMEAQLPRTAGAWAFGLVPGAGISLHLFDTGYPVVDGHVLPETPLDAYASGAMIDVPMITGNVGNEASGLPYLPTLSAYRDYVSSTFESRADEVLRLYPAATDDEARIASGELLADEIFVWSNWTAARLQRRHLKSPAWYYRFLRRPPIPAGAQIVEASYAGAFHTADVMYAFGNLDTWAWRFTAEDHHLSERMMRAWIAFLRTGNPCSPGDEAWPPLGPRTTPVKVWDTEASPAAGGPAADRMTFWDSKHDIAGAL
ncbi:carboxylesterase/lipase family protein [Rhodococcus koreensis]